MPSARSLFHSLSAAVGVSALVLLTGCQGGSTPPETSTTTAPPASSAAASRTPTPAPTSSGAYKPADANGKAQNVPVPMMPALAKENSKEGLEAFIRYWFQLLSYAYETGDGHAAKDLSAVECVLCSDLLSAVATNYTDNRWLVGGQYETPVIEVLWQPHGNQQSAKVQVLQQEIVYMNSDGSQGRAPTSATNDGAAFFANFSNGIWTVTNLGVIR
ncbi:DUF6318 family protein [Paenarthrobacter sp. NPDC058040]|uniref:DUF6318 family protein n=1 Tax=unclassified Paenarthrobacter TaxID=2634190 RepID=UPI0036DA5000